MNSLPWRAAAIDVDNTLVKGQGVSQENREALGMLLNKGVIPILATGRNYHHITIYTTALGLRAPVVTSDGALVRWPHGATICERKLPLYVSRSLMLFAEEQGITCLCFWEDGVYVTTKVDWSDGMENHSDMGSRFRASTVEEMWSAKIYKPLLYANNPQHLDAMQAFMMRRFGEVIDAIRNGPNTLEFISKGVNKVWALEQVAKHLNFQPHEALAFGDGVNDVGMFRWAGMSVCMNHGHESAKSAAKLVAPPTSIETNFAAAVKMVLDLDAQS